MAWRGGEGVSKVVFYINILIYLKKCRIKTVDILSISAQQIDIRSWGQLGETIEFVTFWSILNVGELPKETGYNAWQKKWVERLKLKPIAFEVSTGLI